MELDNPVERRSLKKIHNRIAMISCVDMKVGYIQEEVDQEVLMVLVMDKEIL